MTEKLSEDLKRKPQTLILIDLQEGFYHPQWGQRNNPNLEENITSLLQHLRKKTGLSFIFNTTLATANRLCTKTVLGGLTTEHCVSTSPRMASDYGFKVTLLADATATFERTDFNGNILNAEDVHTFALASLRNEFATLASTAQAIAYGNNQ